MSMNHIMIDLETLGTGTDAAIVSIGACCFDLEEGTISPDVFYQRIDWGSALEQGGFDISTLKWWMEQGDEARLEIIKPGVKLYAALQMLREFIPGTPTVWANGILFDIALLEKAFGTGIPWDFRNVMDMRTLKRTNKNYIKPPANDLPHHALNDAIHQAKVVIAIMESIK